MIACTCAKRNINPGERDQHAVGLVRDQRERTDREKQHRHFKLVVKRVRDMARRGLSRPDACRVRRAPRRACPSALKRTYAIQNSSAKINAACARTGFKMRQIFHELNLPPG